MWFVCGFIECRLCDEGSGVMYVCFVWLFGDIFVKVSGKLRIFFIFGFL